MYYQSKEYIEGQSSKFATHMYQLKPAPPNITEDECIRLYKQNGDFLYFRFFLHKYERRLNDYTRKIGAHYGQSHRFEDTKQTVVLTLMEVAEKFEPERNVPFLAFAKMYVKAAIIEYFRINGSFYSVENANHYRLLRKVTKIYNDSLGETTAARIAEAVEKSGVKEKNVIKLLTEGMNFNGYQSLSKPTYDKGRRSYYDPDVAAPDEYSNPETVVPMLLRYDVMVDAVTNLDYKENDVLHKVLGIACMECGRVCAKMKKQDIANLYEYYSTDAVDNVMKTALASIIRELSLAGWLYSMRITQTSCKEKNGKLISAVYTYEPLLGGEEGSIEFDLTRPAKEGYIIDRFTSFDRQYPFFRRLVREVTKMQECGKFDKTRVLVWVE
jgi:DNA-directed RNA polymerase specialized sigma subunit